MPEEGKDKGPVNYEVPDHSDMAGNSEADNDSVSNFVDKEPETPPIADSPRAEPAAARSFISKNKKKLFIVVAAALVIFGIVAVAYWYAQNSKNKASNNPTITTESENQSEQPAAKKGLNTVAYAFREGTDSPYEIFWRPAGGGDKTLIESLPRSGYISQYDVSRNKVAYVLESGDGQENNLAIHYSSDGGKKYEIIYTAPPDNTDGIGYQVTSLIFSTDGSSLIYGLLKPDSKNEITEINLETKESKVLLTNEGGVFLYGYHSGMKKLIYSEGCYNCDGNLGNTVYLNDLSSDSKKELAASTASNIVSFGAVNKDFTEVLIKSETKDESMQGEGIPGFYVGPPFELIAVSLGDMSKKTIAEFGSKLESNAENQLPYVYSSVGYMEDGTTPYFALDNQIFYVAADGKKSLIYEASSSLLEVYFVGEDNIIASSGLNDFAINNFSIDEKKSNIILNGDVNTVVFGVTVN